jgi:hypothetical protein
MADHFLNFELAKETKDLSPEHLLREAMQVALPNGPSVTARFALPLVTNPKRIELLVESHGHRGHRILIPHRKRKYPQLGR